MSADVPDALAPTGADASERQLVERLKARDGDAFETLVRTHGPKLLSVARRLMRNEEDARDVLQEAFISAYRAIDRFAGQSRLSTWLHRIVINTGLMHMRSRQRRPQEPLEPLLPAFQADGHHVDVFTEWTDAEAQLARAEVRAIVRAAIDRLPESYRTVLLLRDIEELDTAETAQALGLTNNAVKIRLHRARQALRTLLDAHLLEGAA